MGSDVLRELSAAVRLVGQSTVEALWPTRCVICDAPGELLCERCRLSLPYIDALQACPVCGAPNGKRLCTECNQLALAKRGLERFPLDGCHSALVATGRSLRLVTSYKDQGERRMHRILAQLMAPLARPEWEGACLTTIPPRKEALARRGFDHLASIGKDLDELTGLEYVPLLEYTPLLEARKMHDQRNLDARARIRNMQGAFGSRLRSTPERVVVVDDVMTTGATLFAAAHCLRAHGTKEVQGLTVLRV
jgi:predicted amidophosphoribosyltransferase